MLGCRGKLLSICPVAGNPFIERITQLGIKEQQAPEDLGSRCRGARILRIIVTAMNGVSQQPG